MRDENEKERCRREKWEWEAKVGGRWEEGKGEGRCEEEGDRRREIGGKGRWTGWRGDGVDVKGMRGRENGGQIMATKGEINRERKRGREGEVQ